MANLHLPLDRRIYRFKEACILFDEMVSQIIPIDTNSQETQIMATDPVSALRPSARDTLPPPVIPADMYPGVIKSYEITSSSNNNPILRLPVGLLDWPNTIELDKRFQIGPEGEQIPIDLSKKQLRKDFFLTPAAYFRLENFLTAMGFEIATDSNGNKDYETPVSQLIGQKVGVEVQRILARNSGEFINVVGELVPFEK